jgi:hypothetical protein
MLIRPLKKKALRLTQRLDHSVPDPQESASVNQKASAELASLSAKLFWHIPDKSLSTFERLERLGRATNESAPDLAQLQPATKKLAKLKARIDQLVPGDASHEKKLDILLAQLDQKVGKSQASFLTTDKLELLGDPRARIAPEVKGVRRARKKNK